MNEKALRLGPIAVVFGLWATLGTLLSEALLFVVTPELLASDSDGVALVPALIAGHAALSLLLGALVMRRTARVDIGVRGRARLAIGGLVTLVLGAANLALVGLVSFAIFDAAFTAMSATFVGDDLGSRLSAARSSVEAVAYTQGTATAIQIAAITREIASLVLFGIGISTWFLVPTRIRRGLWLALDIPLTAAFIFALWALPFTVREDGDPTLPGIALTIATLFAFRAFARAVPFLLELSERIGFTVLIAARMLRARKSGFLTAIGFLSILAVSFSSCTLTTTLSVMGGFRDDLQRKILGSNAHVVVDREYGTFEGWAPILEETRAVPGVTGASPFVAGEVMVTSASNLGGAVLRGIDPRTIGQVTDLPRNMRHGRLEYLLDPERLLHLDADEMTGSVLDARPFGTPDEPFEPLEVPDGGIALPARPDGPASREHESLLREIDRVLGELDERQSPRDVGIETASGANVEVHDAFGALDEADELLLGTPPPLRRPRDVLPGIIVGQELARSLRLHVGDEVDVVSPLGDLGPAGPIPKSRPFRVAGIFYSGMYEYDMKVVYTDLETAQRFLGTGGAITGVEVRVDDWERAENAANAVREAIARPDLRVRSWQEVNRNLFGALELEKLAMFITLGIAILVASFCIVGTLVLMVREKGRQVGILKAMGARDAHVVSFFMLQGLFIGLVGAISGLGLGWVVCFAAEHLGIVPLNPEVYYIDRLPIHTDPREFLAVGVAAVLVCLLATIYPAILGSRLRPVDALRDA